MVDHQPSIVNFDEPSQMLSDLPFQNEDADLYSWIEGLASTAAPQEGNGKLDAMDRAVKGAMLHETPSWLPPGGLGDPAPQPLFKHTSNVSTLHSGSSDASQTRMVPAPHFPIEADDLSLPLPDAFVPAPQTPSMEAPYLVPDLPRVMVQAATPAMWNQQFPQPPSTLWPPMQPVDAGNNGYASSPVGEATCFIPFLSSGVFHRGKM